MQSLIEELIQTKEELLIVASSISQNQIDTVPFAGGWTAGQVLEHLCKCISTGVLRGNVQQVDRQADEKIAFIRTVFLDFTKKYEAPEFILPTEPAHNKEEHLLKLAAKFDRLLEAVNTSNLAEECIDFALPAFGNFTRMEWIAFHMLHTQRHTQQLKNIVAALEIKR